MADEHDDDRLSEALELLTDEQIRRHGDVSAISVPSYRAKARATVAERDGKQLDELLRLHPELDAEEIAAVLCPERRSNRTADLIHEVVGRVYAVAARSRRERLESERDAAVRHCDWLSVEALNEELALLEETTS